MEFTGKKVLIVGTGKSGVAAAELLQKKQADLIIFDGNKELKEEQVKEKSGAFSDAEIVLGELPESVMEELDLVVLEPWRTDGSSDGECDTRQKDPDHR